MTLRIMMATALLGVAAPTWAASGFYNMPTSVPQCLGYGYGPGYHATMVLKPYYRSWNASKGTIRAQPHQYPPIYNKRAMYGSNFSAPSTLAHVETYQESYHRHYQPQSHQPQHYQHQYQSTPSYTTPNVHSPSPAASFAAPAINLNRTSSEPDSPSDELKPDELPMPNR